MCVCVCMSFATTSTRIDTTKVLKILEFAATGFFFRSLSLSLMPIVCVVVVVCIAFFFVGSPGTIHRTTHIHASQMHFLACGYLSNRVRIWHVRNNYLIDRVHFQEKKAALLKMLFSNGFFFYFQGIFDLSWKSFAFRIFRFFFRWSMFEIWNLHGNTPFEGDSIRENENPFFYAASRI